jgi:hypothetical protein
LNLDVVVPRATRVGCRHDGAKVESAVRPGDDMATISETDVVVFALFIGMPEIDHRSTKRAAASRHHNASKFEPTAPSARLAQVAALRRSWLEKRALRLADGRFIAIVTERRGRKLLRRGRFRTGQFPPGGKHPGVEQESSASRCR